MHRAPDAKTKKRTRSFKGVLSTCIVSIFPDRPETVNCSLLRALFAKWLSRSVWLYGKTKQQHRRGVVHYHQAKRRCEISLEFDKPEEKSVALSSLFYGQLGRSSVGMYSLATQSTWVESSFLTNVASTILGMP